MVPFQGDILGSLVQKELLETFFLQYDDPLGQVVKEHRVALSHYLTLHIYEAPLRDNEVDSEQVE